MAVDPVLSETFSSVNSLLSGINTGIFPEFALNLLGVNGYIPLKIGDLALADLRRELTKTGN
jgi:hypothetical protein